MAAWLSNWRTGTRSIFARLIQPMLFVSLVLVAAGIGLGVVLYRKAGVQDRYRPAKTDPLEYSAASFVSFSRKQDVAGRTLRSHRHRVRRDFRASLRLDGSLFLGRSGARRRRDSVNSLEFSPERVDERGINAGVDETTTGTRGLGRVDVAAGTRGKSKLTSASSPSACSRCCFFTHGWLDHSAISHSAPRRSFRERGAEKLCPRDRARIQRLSPRSSLCMLWRSFDTGVAGLQMVERHAWIPAIGAEYLVGIDGLSLLLVLLTSLIFPFAFLAQRMERAASARSC